MSTSYDLPIPGDTVEGKTVVASVWGNDLEEDGVVFGTVILLNATSPFFSVGQIEFDGSEWYAIPQEHRNHFNINHAVKDFAENGGDI